jgi:hypothetical protein
MGPLNEIEKISFACSMDKTLIAGTWKDKNIICFINNKFGTFMVTTQYKKVGKQIKEDVVVPAVAKDYLKNGMGHVDTFNHNMTSCHQT